MGNEVFVFENTLPLGFTLRAFRKLYLMKMEEQRKRILFVHHGGVAGGAPLSMLYTMQGAQKAGYEPVAALHKAIPELHKLYNDVGVRTIHTPWLPMFITWSGSEGKWWNPFMWKGLYDVSKEWGRGKRELIALLEEESIDLVHLNSVGLSNSAEALMEAKFPFVWHVREHGPRRKGLRFKRISSRLARAAHVVFLSQAERHSWLGHAEHGRVVHNFIDFKKFDDAKPRNGVRHALGLGDETKVILYVGGSKSHKGVIELLETLAMLKDSYGNGFVCLMPDSAIKKASQPTKIELKMGRIIKENGLEDNCRLLPFNPDIVGLFAASDVLVFPATKPHFARPVIEASAMGKPVIASNLKAIDELVKDQETGYLIPVNDKEMFRDKIEFIFKNPEIAAQLGRAGKRFALEEFEQGRQMKKILALYKEALAI